MKCPFCNEEMKDGIFFASKDGAFSFADEVPGVFTNAKKAKGYIAITELEAGKRLQLNGSICQKCRKLVLDY